MGSLVLSFVPVPRPCRNKGLPPLVGVSLSVRGSWGDGLFLQFDKRDEHLSVYSERGPRSVRVGRGLVTCLGVEEVRSVDPHRVGEVDDRWEYSTPDSRGTCGRT